MRRWCIMLLVGLYGCGSATPSPPTSTIFPSVVAAEPAVEPTQTLIPSPIPTPTQPPPPTPTPIDPQSLALRPVEVASLPAFLTNAPRYWMAVEVDPLGGTFQGRQIITYTNTTEQSMTTLVLRSYVNFPPDVMGDGGDTTMNVISADEGGVDLEVSREAQETAFRVTLPEPLPPAATTTIATAFEGTLKPWEDGSWPFVSSYPMLAEWDSTAADWRTDVTEFPDRVFATTAWYEVDVTLPAEFQVFATGSAIGSSTDGSTTTTTFVSGPVREWAASFGDFVPVQARTTDGITVTAFQVRGSTLDTERVLEQAIASLDSFQRRIGPYPYRELDLHVMDWQGDAGVEYPAFTLILVREQVNRRVDFVVSHEVAHQWWYAIVGNDILRDAWLDESFANFSAIVAISDISGPDRAEAVYEQEVARLYRSGKAEGDPPAGVSIDEFGSFVGYYWAVYGKGAVFLQTVRETIGEEAFWAGMREYYDQYRFGIAQTATFRSVMQSQTTENLTPLFEEWIGE